MPHHSPSNPATAILITDEQKLSLQQLCKRCNLSSQKITTYIQEGIITVNSHSPDEWRFSRLAIIRIRKASRLENDLRLNPAGAALALELMEQVETLKLRLKRYED